MNLLPHRSGPRRTAHPRLRRLGIAVAVLAALLLGARLALEPMLVRFVNQKLDEIPDYQGSIEGIDVHLIRGAYRIDGIVLEKTGGRVPVPFFKTRAVDISLAWGELLRGKLVSRIEVTGPELNFVTSPPSRGKKRSEAESQTSIDASWTDKVKDLTPFDIQSFRIREGQIHYRDFHRTPKIDIHVDHLEATARGLTNARAGTRDLPATFNATGRAMDHAALRVDMRLAPLAEEPTFDLNAELTGLRLVELNDFWRAYANVDVEKGTFGLYTEAAAADGRFKGYVKPLMQDIEILDRDDAEKGPLKLMWEAVVAGVTEVLENQPKEQTALQIPIEGRIENPKAGIWPTVGSLLRNAFLEALRPTLNRSIDVGDVKGKATAADKAEVEKEQEEEKRK